MPTVVLADDHILLRKGLASLIESLGHTVLYEADNGQQLIDKLKINEQPQVLLLDINMPVKDGYETAEWVRSNCPLINVLALSMMTMRMPSSACFDAARKATFSKTASLTSYNPPSRLLSTKASIIPKWSAEN